MAEPIALRVDGQIYEGWQKVRITRSLRDIAGDFELSLTRKWDNPGEMVIKPLSACTVHIGNELVLTGYVDDFIPSYDAREVSWVVSAISGTRYSTCSPRATSRAKLGGISIAKEISPLRIRRSISS